MNFTNLQYFLVVAEELNITRAAERLYLSQQSLSNHINRLEKYYNTQLFERTPSLSLTYAGKCLEKTARQIIGLERQVTAQIDDIHHRRRGELRIGISHTRGQVLLPHILPAFHRDNPFVELQIVEGNTAELEEKLRHSQVDLVITNAPVMVPETEQISIADERLFLCVPKHMAERICTTPAQYETMRISAYLHTFSKFPFLMLMRGNYVRTMVDELMLQENIHPNVILEMENIETLLHLSGEGMGITFYPEMFVNELGGSFGDSRLYERLCFFPLSDPITTVHLVAAYKKNRYLPEAAKDFIGRTVDTFGGQFYGW